ncbi:MAG TPA: chemotaxis protein CheB [Steroidobacteraceae bacterium]|jgi:two-component system chemotaxis response regulator CheB|nr:chemotaxis protein CheB [Steroidobacteraceae bacterium]
MSGPAGSAGDAPKGSELDAGSGVQAVVIGASAGGVQALGELLPAFAAGSAAVVFVVLHIPRDRPSLLTEVFSRRCALQVREAQDKEPVAPGTIYFAPANYHLLVDEGPQLALSADDLVHHSRPSIDVLFESAAQVYGSRLLGVILTGANEDGAEGLAAVHDAGGVTVTQEPETAVASTMVLSAMQLRAPDHVLPLDRIASLFKTVGLEPSLRTN